MGGRVGRSVLAALFAVALLTGCRDGALETPSSSSSSSTSGTVGSGGMVGSGGAGGSTATVGTGGMIGEEGPPAEIEKMGTEGKLLLRGVVLTPDEAYDGEVLIDGDTIVCVAPSCAGEPAALDASVVLTHGIILPGMIDTHNHILFDAFDESDWSPSKAYGNHNQWPNEERYSAMIDTKQFINGEAGSPINLNCELNKYGELKGLIAGTTSIIGGANPGNKVCYRTLARTIDQTANGLCGTDPPQSCPDAVQVNTLFPSATSANKVCDNFTSGKTAAYLIHLGEGVDESARGELDKLITVTTPDGCLLSAKTTVIHGTAFGEAELEILAQAGVGISWSPRSNVFLYGSGTDFTKTTDIPLALAKGITVALSPDWSLGGSDNLLDELGFANQVNIAQFQNLLSAKDLVAMVTTRAAEVLALQDQIGSLKVGMKADIMVIGGDVTLPYRSVVEGSAQQVRMTIVDGKVLYGSAQLEALGPSSPGCEKLDVCSRSKFVCVAIDGGTASDKFGQTLSEISTALSDALTAYDAMDLTAYDFAPIAPLTKCD